MTCGYCLLQADKPIIDPINSYRGNGGSDRANPGRPSREPR